MTPLKHIICREILDEVNWRTLVNGSDWNRLDPSALQQDENILAFKHYNVENFIGDLSYAYVSRSLYKTLPPIKVDRPVFRMV
jgi:hypothetical protein